MSAYNQQKYTATPWRIIPDIELDRQAAVTSQLGFLAINLNPRLQGSKLFVNRPTRWSGRLPEHQLARRLQLRNIPCFSNVLANDRVQML